jgi:nucleotide-binding universal stress UspA family protein
VTSDEEDAVENWRPGVVIVGVDGSDQSLRAAQVAAAIARSVGGRLHVVTVVRPPEGWWGVVGSPPPADALSASMADAQRSALDRTLDRLPTDGIELTSAEEIGDPASALTSLADDMGADLLVVGRRGAGMVERLILGSVADRVAHDAPCPVLIVP